MEVIETTTKQCLPRQFSNDTSARLKQALVGARSSEKIAIRRAKEWSNLIANFAGDQSADRVKAPEWDLAFVLGTLLEEPFESFDKAE